MARNKIIKRSTLCRNCGKTVSHGVNDPPYELCFTCRKLLDIEDFELQLFYQMTDQYQSFKGRDEKV